MAVCPKCKAQAASNVKFCGQCGASMEQRLCPNGHVMEPGWDTCRYCPTAPNLGATRVVKPTRVASQLKVVGAQPEAPMKKPSTTTQLYGENKREIGSPLLGWLVVTQGKEQWRDYRVTEGHFILGRDKECEVVVDDEHASSRHASLRFKEGKVLLTDLDSSNGTFVNGEQISRAELNDNAEIKIGDTVLKFKKFE
jgi:hypothetical protein